MFKKTIAVGPFEPFAGGVAVVANPFLCFQASPSPLRTTGLMCVQELFGRARPGNSNELRSDIILEQ
jgi:hypothetical protein